MEISISSLSGRGGRLEVAHRPPSSMIFWPPRAGRRPGRSLPPVSPPFRGKSLRSGWPSKSSQEDDLQVGVPFEDDAQQVVGLALHPVGAGPHARGRGHLARRRADLHAEAPRSGVPVQVDHLEAPVMVAQLGPPPPCGPPGTLGRRVCPCRRGRRPTQESPAATVAVTWPASLRSPRGSTSGAERRFGRVAAAWPRRWGSAGRLLGRRLGAPAFGSGAAASAWLVRLPPRYA